MTLKYSSQSEKRCSNRNYATLYYFAIFFVLRAISAQECFDDGNEFCIDQDDILSVDLLPGSFLFTDQHLNDGAYNAMINESIDGSFYRALNEMNYHRKRMNEYLCHGYMAEEIFKQVSIPRVKRRPESSPNDKSHNFLSNDNVTTHDSLLADEGSSKYKNWLQRTTTLDDIYRHYTPRKKIKKKQDIPHNIDEKFDGEVTGFAMQAPLPSGKVGFYEPSHGEDDTLSSSTGHHSFHYGPMLGYHHDDHFGHHGDFFPSIHEEYHYSPPQHHEEEYHKPSYSKGKSHDLSIRDFFEIALTALAFLAFGLFIIQLFMNATNNNGSMMMTTGRERLKRDIISLTLSSSTNEDLNDLSYRVLRSIEAAMIAEADSGNCLRKILCENNQYSKQTTDGRRIWIPVWSLGMSWVSGRILGKTTSWSAILNSVKASVLGLGGIDCASFYPKCNLRKERLKRRHKKRK